MPGLTLGQRLKRARLALGLTQEALGQPDLTKGFISLLEHDRAKPSVQTLQRLSQRLGRPIAYFLEDGTASMAHKAVELLGVRGRSELVRGRHDAALAAFTDMRELAASHHDARMEMHAVLGLGEALLGLRRLDEARPHLDEALARGREAKDPVVECRALHGLATVEHRNGHFPRAVSLYKAALAVVPPIAGVEPNLHGEIWLFLGTVLTRMGHMDEALDANMRAREIFEDASRPEKVGEALQGLANVLASSGEYDAALMHYERARVLFEQHEDLQMTSYVRNNLGMLLVQVGRAQEALDHFTISLAIKQRLGDAVGECRTLTEVARCHFVCGDHGRARECADRAIARSRETRVPDEEARAQIVLGAIAAEEGDLKSAQQQLVAAARHCEQAEMMPEIVTVCRELAKIASAQGRYKDAAAYQDQAFLALRRVGPHDVVAALTISDLMARHLPAAEDAHTPG